MCRFLLVSLFALGLVAGCAQPQPMMGEMKKPSPAPELAKLQPWLGSWAGVAEMVSPIPNEMQKAMPEGSKEKSKGMPGAEKVEWTLGGMALKSEGWYEICEGKRANYVHYVAWDAKAKKYHGWSLTDWGETSESWMTVDANGKVFHMTEKGMDAEGRPTAGEGTVTLVDDKTMEWTYTANTPQGKVQLKGTSKKQP
jgi:hypothetical protein